LRPRLSLSLATFLAIGCAHGRDPYAATDNTLGLDRVVLYRNGIGYFERSGAVDGEVLTIKVRKDQINDLLKSLTVVDRKNGQAVSVSMPLDPQMWANAALATLSPGQGSLPEVLDALRGTDVILGTTQGKLRGRIVMLERILDEPDASPPAHSERVAEPKGGSRDWKITLLDGKKMHVVRVSKIKTVTLRDGDLALQFHRSLDATAGEGMFQQVAVDIRLAGAKAHDLSVSYVVAAPMWKPTYRVVLPDGGKGNALLQGWAVVDNVSGEDWAKVSMSLTSGAPIAFQYDLHTPRLIPRTDLTGSGVEKRAAVAMGETSYGTAGPDSDLDGIGDVNDRCPSEPETYNGQNDQDGCPDAAPVVASAPTTGMSYDEKAAEMADYDDAWGEAEESSKSKKKADKAGAARRAKPSKASAGPGGRDNMRDPFGSGGGAGAYDMPAPAPAPANGERAGAGGRLRVAAAEHPGERAGQERERVDAVRPRQPGDGAGRHVDDGGDHQPGRRRRADVPV
jgi:hypothetical protein